jgi:hypothetical protein
MSGHGEQLSRRQEEAIGALLRSRSIRKAAAAAGVSDRTLRNWLAAPGFADAYRAARRQLVQHAVCQVQRATGRAVRTLVRLLSCGHPSVEARAAATLLDTALRGIEQEELVGRLEALEEAQRRREQEQRGRAGRNGRAYP